MTKQQANKMNTNTIPHLIELISRSLHPKKKIEIFRDSERLGWKIVSDDKLSSFVSDLEIKKNNRPELLGDLLKNKISKSIKKK